MNLEQFLAICRRMIAILDSSTNKSIVRNVMREVENENATIAAGIAEIRDELRGSDADRDDPKINEALNVLNEAVRENRSSGEQVDKRERDLFNDLNGIDDDIETLEKRKAEIKQLALSHRSQLGEKDLEEYNAELKLRIEKIDAEIKSKRKEQGKLESEIRGIKKEMNNNIVLEQYSSTRQERAMAAGLGAAKILMTERSKGKVKHKLSNEEIREILRYNTAESIATFTNGAINLRDNPDFAAITTTDKDFVAATATTLGINNGGVFIPVEALYDLLQIKPRESSFFQRVRKISVAAKIDFPYSKGNTGADWYAETDCMDYEQIEWGVLELGRNGLGKYIQTTWELEAMTPETFLRYLLQEVRNEMDKALNHAVVYGRGKDYVDAEGRKRPQPYGVTFQTTDSNQKGVSATKKLIGAGGYKDILEAMEKLPGDLFKINPDALDGAEYFMSFPAYMELWNAKDGNGDRMFDIIRPMTSFGPNALNINIDYTLQGKDIIFGNPANYILNTILPIAIYNDKSIRCRANMYGAFGMFDGMGKPTSFIFASDSAEPRGSIAPDVEAFRKKIKFRGSNSGTL